MNIIQVHYRTTATFWLYSVDPYLTVMFSQSILNLFKLICQIFIQEDKFTDFHESIYN